MKFVSICKWLMGIFGVLFCTMAFEEVCASAVESAFNICQKSYQKKEGNFSSEEVDSCCFLVSQYSKKMSDADLVDTCNDYYWHHPLRDDSQDRPRLIVLQKRYTELRPLDLYERINLAWLLLSTWSDGIKHPERYRDENPLGLEVPPLALREDEAVKVLRSGALYNIQDPAYFYEAGLRLYLPAAQYIRDVQYVERKNWTESQKVFFDFAEKVLPMAGGFFRGAFENSLGSEVKALRFQSSFYLARTYAFRAHVESHEEILKIKAVDWMRIAQREAFKLSDLDQRQKLMTIPEDWLQLEK